jgi:hypothetical protein
MVTDLDLSKGKWASDSELGLSVVCVVQVNQNQYHENWQSQSMRARRMGHVGCTKGRETRIEYWSENLMERKQLLGLDIDGNIG